MNVYIEYVIIDNLVIDYLLLKTTLLTTNLPFSKGKCVLGAIIGTVVALFLPLINNVGSTLGIIGVLIKISTGLLMVVLASGKQNLKTYLINFAVFFGYTFACGGAIKGIFNLLGLNYSAEISVALIFLPVWLILSQTKKLITTIYQKRSVVQNVYVAELTLNGVTVKVNGLMDTGNGLLDNGNPVIICNKKTAEKFFCIGATLPKISKLQVYTINGKSTFNTIKLERVILYTQKDKRIHNNVTACVAKTWGAIGYDAILHPLLMEGKNVKNVA